MLDTDKAYAAGFFDGEGHIEYNGPYNLQVSVAQLDRTPLDWLVTLFGGYVRHSQGNKRYNGIYNWHTNTREAARFLDAVLPYLIVKKEHAQEALDKWNNRLKS